MNEDEKTNKAIPIATTLLVLATAELSESILTDLEVPDPETNVDK